MISSPAISDTQKEDNNSLAAYMSMPSNDSGPVAVMKWSTQSAITTCLAKHMGVLDRVQVRPDLQLLRWWYHNNIVVSVLAMTPRHVLHKFLCARSGCPRILVGFTSRHLVPSAATGWKLVSGNPRCCYSCCF